MAAAFRSSFNSALAHKKNVLVTGANRGLGLGFVKQLLQRPEVGEVFATYRNESSAQELMALTNPRLHRVPLEVDSDKSIKTLYKTVSEVLKDKPLNMLINNAGVCKDYHTKMSVPDRKQFRDVFETNVVSVVCLTQTLLPLLAKTNKLNPKEKATIIMMTSFMASIGDNDGTYAAHKVLAYQTSKTALNQVGKSMAIDLEEDGIRVVCVNPGHVMTDMGGPQAPLTIDNATSDMVNSFLNIKDKHNGLFTDRFLTPMEY